MVTFFVEEVELPIFDPMIAFTIYTESHEKMLLVTSWTEVITS